MKYLFITIFLFAGLKGLAQPYWHPVVSGTDQKLLSISFGDMNTGYIGGADSTLLKTTDGGQTWTRIPLSGISFPASVGGKANDVVDVDFVSANVGYITVSKYQNTLYQGVVYKTVDGGVTWTQPFVGNIAAARSYFFSEGNGYVIGSAFFAGYVINKIGGDTSADYHYFSNWPTQFLHAIDFRNARNGIVAGDNGLVCRTSNGGVTWDTAYAATGDSTIYAVQFLDDHTVLAATNNPGGSLLISADAGQTWNVEFNSLTFDYPVMKSLAFSKKDSFIAVGASTSFAGKGMIYWHDHIFNRFERVDQPMNGVTMKNDTIAYAVGDSGLIVTNFPGGNPSGIAGPGKADYALNIYPNPAGDQLITELPVAHTLRVLDMAGRLVWRDDRLLKQHFVNLSGQPAGMYLVEAEAEGATVSGKVLHR